MMFFQSLIATALVVIVATTAKGALTVAGERKLVVLFSEVLTMGTGFYVR